MNKINVGRRELFVSFFQPMITLWGYSLINTSVDCKTSGKVRDPTIILCFNDMLVDVTP
jgi:hypothetical protein